MRLNPFGRSDEPTVRVAFVCVENAGRSQMAAALARRECERRGLERVRIDSAGTHPADAVHPVVVEAMAEIGVDLSSATPTLVDLERLQRADYVVSMGCYIAEFTPTAFGGDSRRWELTDPAGRDIETVRRVREQLDARVYALLDEIEREVTARV